MKPLVALCMVLAVYRCTVLLLKDYIAEPVRCALRSCPWQRVRAHLDYLTSCPWCCSMWVAAVIVPLTICVRWWWGVDAVLACSALTGIALDGVKP